MIDAIVAALRRRWSAKSRIRLLGGYLALGVVLTSCQPATSGRPGTDTPGPTAGGPRAPAPGRDQPELTGFYSLEQASRGERLFQLVCSECHTIDQFSGRTFIGSWNGVPVAELYSLIATTMPYDAPASLSPQQYVDIVAYVLAMNELPGGGSELPADTAVLARLTIEAASP